jgi:uncharacterized protein YqcC (DUF446 family)
VTADTLINELLSALRSALGESKVRSSECSRSATHAYEPSREKSTEFLQWFLPMHSGLLIELTELPHQFRIEKYNSVLMGNPPGWLRRHNLVTFG